MIKAGHACARLAAMLLGRLDIDSAAFHVATGWEIKPEGACKAEVCVPLPSPATGVLDVPAVAERLGMALVHDADQGIWALGPETVSGHALVSASAPELVLPDLHGNEFHLSSLRGQKVLLVAWAPY